MESKDSSVLNKLIILYLIDKIDVPLAENSILKACFYENSWLEYVDIIPALHQLVENGFLFRKMYEKIAYFSISPSGRQCICEFYTKIPLSIRTDIASFVKENRLIIRRRQEYPTSYQLNPDKSYTVILKIIDPTNATGVTMDLKFIVPNKNTAKAVAEKWIASAPTVYSSVYEHLIDE
ncbi:MAG: DUF4364 family protein [Firmicutes bacterium]|nr:DUF4364 family protein [Bacillota bacterium]